MRRRTAIVLHGPMGVGKTTVAEELCRRLGVQAHVNLDDYYKVNDPRISGPTQRYQELWTDDDHLVLELGCAEPIDLAVPGATRGATEWYDFLQRSGRAVLLVRLTADWPTIQNRMRATRSDQILCAQLWHTAYANEIDIVTFPPAMRQVEHIVSTDGKSTQQVVDDILRFACLA